MQLAARPQTTTGKQASAHPARNATGASGLTYKLPTILFCIDYGLGLGISGTRSPFGTTFFLKPRMVLQPEILKLLRIAAVSLSNEMKLRIRFPSTSMRLNACRASQPAPGMADHAGGRLQLPGIS